LPDETKQDLFAWCVAATLTPQLAVEDGADPVIESALQRLAIPFADFWRPTAANYWGRAKKAHALAVAEAVLGERWAHDHSGDKKPALAAALEQAFDPASDAAAAGLDPAVLNAAAVWLPPGIAASDIPVQGDGGEHGATETCPGLRAGVAPEADPPDQEFGGVEAVPADLPAFLTGEEPG
jgi:ParB family chromosome partitioning protein